VWKQLSRSAADNGSSGRARSSRAAPRLASAARFLVRGRPRRGDPRRRQDRPVRLHPAGHHRARGAPKVGTLGRGQELGTSAPARRCPTCRTSATPMSARARTSAPARSPANYDGRQKNRTKDRKEREDERPHEPRRAAARRRPGVHWRQLGDHRGCSQTAPSQSPGQRQKNIEGLRGPQGAGGLAEMSRPPRADGGAEQAPAASRPPTRSA